MRRICTVVAVVLYAPLAQAGGFETPDNGTEALGRGGAFTAKASDATALEYNIAGLANQRGTRVLFDGKMTFDNETFSRAGVYPDNPQTVPWGNKFYPQVSNQGVPLFAPFIGLTSDFHYFEKLTFAVGLFAPSGVGNPVYPYGIDGGVPSPSRYDILSANSTIVLPTVGFGWRVSDWLDVGLAGHAVLASFNLSNTAYVDLGCANVESYKCDTINNLVMSGTTWTASGGAMLHPDSWLDLGINVRGPMTINANGTINSTTFAGTQSEGAATLQTSLPWNIRGGARVKFNDGDFEQGDLELDGVYEPWGSTANGGNVYVAVPAISGFTNVETTVRNNFQDVFSLRLGGAVNFRTGGSGVFTIRAGTYYESPSTLPADTRLDFNTLAKYAGTFGLGFSYRGVGLNVAFAEIYSPERVVTNGDVAPVNPAQHGQSIDANGNPLPPVNNGTYDASIQMISFGLRVEIETLIGTNRSRGWSPQGTGPFDAPAAPAAKPAPKDEEPAVEAKPAAKPPEKKKAEPAPPPRDAAPASPKKPEKPKPDNDDKTRQLENPFAT
jgi:long-subunit fatty acid transport protein